MRWNVVIAAALALAAFGTPAIAQTEGGDPFVVVSDRDEHGAAADGGAAWYLLPMSIRPTGTVVAGVAIAAINAFRERLFEDRPAIGVDPWCFANALSERSFTSSSPVVQANIEQSFAQNPDHRFQLRGRFTGGSELTALVGHYQGCAGGTGSFIMLIDPATSPPTLVYVDELPLVSGLQYMRLADGDITVSTCFECGDLTGLFYDRRRRRFYWESLGD